jgi:hypothetical protein
MHHDRLASRSQADPGVPTLNRVTPNLSSTVRVDDLMLMPQHRELPRPYPICQFPTKPTDSRALQSRSCHFVPARGSGGQLHMVTPNNTQFSEIAASTHRGAIG